MIVKKVKNPRKSASKAARVGRLMDYICAPERENAGEKCLYASARGFLSSDYASQRAEMLALSQEAVRSRDTINHYVLSWQEGEQPTPKQVEEAVDIFLHELGLDDHQAMYGLHVDTANVHLHIAVNRVHPETMKVIKPNRGFDIEAAHRAVARIEDKQGWQREEHGRYRVLDGGEVTRERHGERARQPEQAKRDMEQRTGEKSAERIAIEEGAPIIQRATSWQDLHRALAEKGMRYERTGSGAVLFVNEVGVKASRADRNASLGKLEKRLGPYEAAPERQVAARPPEPVERQVPEWERYIAARHAHLAEKEAALRDHRQRQAVEREELAERNRRERADVLQGRWKGKGELRNALESILAARRAAEKAAMQDRQRDETAQLRRRYRPFPDLEQWLRELARPDLAEQWRYRASAVQRIVGERGDPPRQCDIRDYVAEIKGVEVHYARRDQAAREMPPAFIDKGSEIDVYAWRERAGLLAALQLAAEKWEGFAVDGKDRYKALCVELAAEHGFKLANPELQDQLAQARQRIAEREVMAAASVATPATLPPGGKRGQADHLSDTSADSMQRDRAAKAYACHFKDIAARHTGGALDLSRVDAMIAVRMRMTGHQQDDVERTLRQLAPHTRQKDEGRDWNQYARRTAAYAFGAAGDRQAQELEKYRQQWAILEGRAEVERDRKRGLGLSR